MDDDDLLEDDFDDDPFDDDEPEGDELPDGEDESPRHEVNVVGGVWGDLVGQDHAIATLRRAVAAADAVLAQATRLPDAHSEAGLEHAMTHAWLITGPPGSGRSNAARAFAAALECPDGGCGVCNACTTALSGAHPDVTLVRTEQLSIGVDQVRELALKSALRPARRRWQVIVIEDADRVTDKGANALLKSLEEPPARTVWVLCAPSADDVIMTIRSRTREVRLVTPSDDAVAELLVRRDGVDLATARRAARAAQGHIGRARALATDAQAWQRREAILALPGSLTSLNACLQAAARLIESAQKDAEAITAPLDAKERAALNEALGIGGGTKPRNAQSAINELEDQQKARAKRLQRDSLDRVITELTAWYRDVLAVQIGAVEPEPALAGARPAGPGLINPQQSDAIRQTAAALDASQILRRIDALLLARTRLESNVTPLLAMESLLIALGQF
ncbi:MAG: DNA polymerase III subunit delta' [Propionibacteriaceae bacterium]|nr:DNA polymerase III subunit delta' [Propionibacteriaceae bacterium]